MATAIAPPARDLCTGSRELEARHSRAPLRATDLGLVPYAAAWALQEKLAAARTAGQATDTLLLLEHPPVVTVGRRGSMADVYRTEGELRALGIELARTTRGGLVTYHGPGQLVGYPILGLRDLGLRVPEYVHRLERALVGVLAKVGVEAWSRPDHVGVWAAGGKIAAIGIARRHGVSLHGFALNLDPNLHHFQLLNACGIGDLGVTSAARELGRSPSMAECKRALADVLSRELGFKGVDWGAPFDTMPLPKSD